MFKPYCRPPAAAIHHIWLWLGGVWIIVVVPLLIVSLTASKFYAQIGSALEETARGSLTARLSAHDEALDYLPLLFIPNAGQTQPGVYFQARAWGGNLAFRANEIILRLPPAAEPGSGGDLAGPQVSLHFEQANPRPDLRGLDRQAGIVNYFIGNDPTRWQSNLPTYATLSYGQLYPGIDLRYDGASGAGDQGRLLKGTFTIAPGADPGQIRWRYAGAEQVRLEATSGDLLITLPAPELILTPKSGKFPSLREGLGEGGAWSPKWDYWFPSTSLLGREATPSLTLPLIGGGNLRDAGQRPHLVESAPIAWQTINGRRAPVEVHYSLEADGVISLALPQGYDPARPLIIDPVLSYSTYLGGSSYDYGQDIAVDAEGNTYITGFTFSTDFPTTSGSKQEGFGGGVRDVFVVKLNPSGSDLIYATYLGGNASDVAYGIAVDEQGYAYLTGETSSIDFPTQNPIQTNPGLQYDAFIAKLAPNGAALIYSTRLGGSRDETSFDIALDDLGNAFVTGYTQSTDFPRLNAIQPEPNFGQDLDAPIDAFVTTVISRSGVYTWGYSTYLGGTEWDEARSLTLDGDGNPLITGRTRSTDFPTRYPAQPAFNGGSFDVFVTKIISASGVYTWGYSTYLGGSGSETGYGIAVTSGGAPYITGETTSDDFPLVNAAQGEFGGDRDAFVTKIISASGVYTWGYSTYLGGSGDDLGRGIALDGDEAVYVAGYSFSPDFPITADAYDSTCGTDDGCSGGGDVFVTKLDDNSSEPLYSTYLGGRQTDFGDGLALDDQGNVYLTGNTFSADFPVTTAAYDSTCNLDGQCQANLVTDAFVAKLTMNPQLILAKTAQPPGNQVAHQGQIISYTLVAGAGDITPTNVVISDTIPNGLDYISDTLDSTLGQATFDGAQIRVSLPVLSANTSLTVTFQVEVTASPTTTLVNKAVLSSDQFGPLDSNPLLHFIQEAGQTRLYLPLIFKNFGPPAPPPPSCAPYLITTIDVGNAPQGLAVDATRGRVYVANQGSNSLSVIDSNNQTVIKTISGLAAPKGVAFDPGRNLIWVTSLSGGTVTPIQADSTATGFSLLPPVSVGEQPWDVAYDPLHDAMYVVNHGDNSLTVIEAGTRAVTATLTGAFDQPFHLAANPVTGKLYVANFGDNSLTVVKGTTVAKTISLFDSSQPYGLAIDEKRNLIYVSTVDSHRIVVVDGLLDDFLGWAAFTRGSNPSRPVPLRAMAINPDIGPAGDGGHLWSLTTTADGSEQNQLLLIPKGWSAYFSAPVPYNLNLAPTADLAIDRSRNQIYLANGLTPGAVAVFGDGTDVCLKPFNIAQSIRLQVYVK